MSEDLILSSRLTGRNTMDGKHAFIDAVDHFFDGEGEMLDRLHVLAQALEESDDSVLHYHFGKTPLESKRAALISCVMAKISVSARKTKSFYNSFRAFFRSQLDSFKNNMALYEEDDMDQSGDLSDENQNHFTWRQDLEILGWLSKGGLLRDALKEAVDESILTHVKETIAFEFETPMYENLRAWQEHVVRPWLEKIVSSEDDMEDCYTVAQAYVTVRKDEIFDMVADYPDSIPTIEELQSVLVATQLHRQVADALRETLIRRLNHTGANTLQIIDVYINTIKVLRILDPTDHLLARVAEPVRQYLQGRQDTVRCIIASLTNAEQGGDLYEELKRQDAKPLEDVSLDSDDEGDCLPDYLGDQLWQPPPSIQQTHPSFLERGGSGKTTDILAMLVSIYGSKELFVNEYRLMLADKLLSNTTDYNTDQQVHTLELLKLRFGELSMRACEIMLKDINDSKRTNTNIRSFLPESCVDAIMISHIFWPALQREPSALKHHPRLQYMLDTFSQEYGRLKNPRKLDWLYPLGTVELELEVQEKGQLISKTIECPPPLASLILHFSDRPQWSAQDLSNETSMPVHVIQKQMAFWINHRVIKIVTDPQQKHKSAYALVGCSEKGDLSPMASRNASADAAMHDDIMGGAVSFTTYEEQEMEVFTSYIVSMLTNLGQLPLKTIHNNLKMFVTGSDVKYSKTPQQLSAFLQHLCRQERLECGPDGQYKLLKK